MYVAPYCIVRMSGSRLTARYSIMRRLCIVCGSRLSEEQRGCRSVTILEPTMGGALNYYCMKRGRKRQLKEDPLLRHELSFFEGRWEFVAYDMVRTTQHSGFHPFEFVAGRGEFL